MVKIKPIIFSAGAAFVFSFFTALFARSGLPIALLKAVVFAAVFGGIAVGVQFVFGIFLSDGGGSAPQEVAEERQRVGGKVDLVVSEEDLPDDKEAPSFFVDGRRVVTDEDVAANAAAAASSMKSLDGGSDGAISAREQNQALEAAEGVRAQKAAENIEKKAQEVSEAKAAAKAEASSGEAKPSFAPIDLAAQGQAAEVSEESVPTVVSEEREAPKAPAKPSDPELDELPDISGFGSSGGSAAVSDREDDGVIEDSEFAQDGSVKIHRQTELADGKVADVKDAPVYAEAIRTILKKEE